MGVRANLPYASLNLKAWIQISKGHPDEILLQFIAYGFPIGVEGADFTGVVHNKNHTSALEHTQQIKEYLADEVAHNSMIGPFSHPPLKKLLINPLMTAPKDQNKIRVITDLSFPHSASVNDYTPCDSYLTEPAKCSLPKFQDFAAFIVGMGRNCWLYSVDIARAYRSMMVCPRDIHYLGIYIDGEYYIDLAMAFGLRNGSNFCQGLTRITTAAHRAAGHNSMGYIDDNLGGAPTEARAHSGFTSLINLLEHLNWPSSKEKNVPPTQQLTYCGLLYDTTTLTVSLSEKRRQKVLDKIDAWKDTEKASLTSLQKLCGHLLSAAQVTKYGRSFLNSMLAALRQAAKHGTATLNEDFRTDLSWFRKFVEKVYIPYPLAPSTSPRFHLEVDASLTQAGAICSGTAIFSTFDNETIEAASSHQCTPSACQICYPTLIPSSHLPSSTAYSTPFDAKVIDQSKTKSERPCISVLELTNATAALRYFADILKGQRVVIACDNEAAVSVLNTGRARCSQMATAVRTAWLTCALHNIDMVAVHTPGVLLTKPDALSRRGTDTTYDSIISELIEAGVSINYPDPAIFSDCI